MLQSWLVNMVFRLFMILAVCGCYESRDDRGPFDMESWISLCEKACEQLGGCYPDQLIFDHGDLDNCKRTCGVQLANDENKSFVNQTEKNCIEALYEESNCVFDLDCEDLSDWKAPASKQYPCDVLENEVKLECNEIDYQQFANTIGFPIKMQGF